MLGGIPGVAAAKVLILGAGVVGRHALQIAVGMGAHVSIMDGDFDKSAFTSADLRNLTRIETGSKKPKLLTSHPKESYTLTPGEDKLVTLEITDPAKFWSISKYLVIRK